MLDRVRAWWYGSPFGLEMVTRIDLLLALVLSAWAVVLVSGVDKPTNPQGGFWACAAVLLMTVPVAWRRAAPLAAIATLAGGALFNAIVVGSFVRCGATLPSLALVVFSVGSRCALRPALLGLGLAWVSAVSQASSDPRLKGFAIGGCLLITALWAVGRLVHSREALAGRLRGRTDELRRQRDRTAALAVAADRARVAEDLDAVLGPRIGKLATDAAAARDALDGRPEVAHESLTAIEHEGRQTLGEMREIVGALRDDEPLAPQPTVDDIEALLARAVAPDARLTVSGERHRLPAGVELSAFRIVERLLEPLEDVPKTRVQVALRYEPDALEVGVTGHVRTGADIQTTLATAREWASVHAGTLESRVRSGVAQTNVRLPLVAAHA